MSLDFNEERHEYRLNGVIVPSVTTILSSLTDLSMIDPEVVERKRQIGSAVHYAIELGDDLDPRSLDNVVVPYYMAWLQFVKEVKPVILGRELRVASEVFQYAGTLDLHLAIGRREAIVDLKCTAALSPVTALQTAGYERAFRETRGFNKSLQRYALWLQHDETYRLRPHEDPRDVGTFLSFLNVYNWRKKHG